MDHALRAAPELLPASPPGGPRGVLNLRVSRDPGRREPAPTRAWLSPDLTPGPTSMSECRASLCRRLAVVLVLLLHAGLLAWSACWHSPTYDETAHLPAGIHHWRFGGFE